MTATSPDQKARAEGLQALMQPRSVAIVGASTNQKRFGGRPIQYLIESGFAGPIYPVNPMRDEVQGLKAYGSLADVPGPIDCAILAIGSEDTMTTVAECARLGVKSAILYAAGFAEMGEGGLEQQGRILETARRANMRLLGPNCMGVFNANAGFYGTFASALEVGLPPPGRIGLVSQSGGFGGYVLKRALLRGLGLSCWATTGNEADVDAGELLRWMAARDDVDMLVGYLEGIRDHGAMVEALELAHRNRKPVVLMKVGRTAEGSAAAASHTASLTGEDKVYEALFQRYGVHRADSTDELLDIAYAVTKKQVPAGRRIGVISMSGGVGVQISDYIGDAGLKLGVVPDEVQAKLREIVPNCAPRNPVDMTGLLSTDHNILRETANLVLGSNAFDAIVIFLGITGSAPSMAAGLQESLTAAVKANPGRLIFLAITAPRELQDAYDELGLIVFEDPSRAVKALSALVRFRESFETPLPTRPRLFDRDLDWPADPRFNEAQAKALVAACGVRSPRELLARTAEEAAAAAAEIGGRVAVKVVSADILHKTEVGGVALGLTTPQAAAEAVTRMAAEVPLKAPDAVIDGYLVSEMIEGGVECIIGVHHDPALGAVVTFGLGGVLVELLKDTTCRLAPIGTDEAAAMIGEIKAAPLLTGYRGGPRYDVGALAEAISALSRLAATYPDRIASLEVNPAVVMPGDGGVVALDAVVQPPSSQD